MKTFELTLQLRNNQLKARREQLGLGLVALAKRARVAIDGYSRLERLVDSPIGRGSGFGAVVGWRRIALRLAEFHGVSPDELFPAHVRAIQKSRAVLELDGAELFELAAPDELDLLPSELPSPEQALMARETASIVDECLRHQLKPRMRRVLLDRVADEQSLEEVGATQLVSKERVRQLVTKAIRTMQGPTYRAAGKKPSLSRRVRDGDV